MSTIVPGVAITVNVAVVRVRFAAKIILAMPIWGALGVNAKLRSRKKPVRGVMESVDLSRGVVCRVNSQWIERVALTGSFVACLFVRRIMVPVDLLLKVAV